MKADRAGDGINEYRVGHRAGNYVREVNSQEESGSQHWSRVEVADKDKDEKYQGQEVASRGDDARRRVRAKACVYHRGWLGYQPSEERLMVKDLRAEVECRCEVSAI